MSSPLPRNEYRKVRYRPPRERDRGRDPAARETVRRPSEMAMYWRFVRTYLMPHRGVIVLCILLVSLNACSVYLMAYYGRVVVDYILVVTPPAASTETPANIPVSARDLRPPVRGAPAHGNLSDLERARQASPRPAGASRRLWLLFSIYLVTVLILNVAARIAERLRIRVSKELTARLREDVHEKILALSQSYHQLHSPGRLMARILSDVNVVQKQMMRTLFDAGSSIVMFLVGATILLILEWRVALMVFVAMIPYAFLIARVRKKVSHVNRELRHTNACLFGLVTQKLDAIKAIFAYVRELHERLNFHRLSACFLRDALVQQRLGAGLNRSATVITSVTTVGIFLYGTQRVLDGSMTLGKMMYIYGAAANLFVPVLQLTQMSLVISSLLVVLHRLTQVIDEPIEILEPENALDFPAPLYTGLHVQHVTFAYSDDTEPVLRDINVKIPAGKWICIMGPSGGGKSTLLHLLARLYDPTEGHILVDGKPLSAMRIASVRRHLALVPQEAQIFSGLVRSNIAYGYPDATPAEIMAAARAAECHDFIMDLPVRYETVIGEKGMTLSGGQRQRISIARALLTNPDVLLLDDCTSALDADTEQRIQATLSRLLAGRTAVIVSQRISMAVRCDRIIVLENGAVTERGTHSELVAGAGFYSRLYAQQTR